MCSTYVAVSFILSALWMNSLDIILVKTNICLCEVYSTTGEVDISHPIRTRYYNNDDYYSAYA